jgi:hypothetical protein
MLGQKSLVGVAAVTVTLDDADAEFWLEALLVIAAVKVYVPTVAVSLAVN